MISDNDLYDLSAILTRIRNDVQYELNDVILDQSLYVLRDTNLLYEDNPFRVALSKIDSLDKSIWYFVYCNNVYARRKIIKDTTIYVLLICICDELKYLLQQNKYLQAADLADAIHCLPEIIANNKFEIPKPYWKTYIKPYRDKWNNDFLKKEQKARYSKWR